jgi:hypothetical protein
MSDLSSIAVKDFAMLDIKLKATCRSCGRDRIIEGGLLAREFQAEDRLTQFKINSFAKRLVCGNCKGRWPNAMLVVDADRYEGR